MQRPSSTPLVVGLSSFGARRVVRHRSMPKETCKVLNDAGVKPYPPGHADRVAAAEAAESGDDIVFVTRGVDQAQGSA
jgi:hypothetical protein